MSFYKGGQITLSRYFFIESETFPSKKKLICIMSKTSKITTIGVSLASGALLAAWLLTGSRKETAKKIISKGTATLKKTIRKDGDRFDDSEAHYI
jgi:hypothetical protein